MARVDGNTTRTNWNCRLLQYLFLQFRSALLLYRQEADVLDAVEKAIAAPATSYAAIELIQMLPH
jgi:hypothetical protein